MVASCSNVPNFSAWLENIWGAGGELSGSGYAALFTCASGFTFGINPPYFLDDFLAVYPKFFGTPVTVPNCTSALGSPAITVPTANGFALGQFVQATGVLPPGSVVVGISGNMITFNNSALVASSTVSLTVFQQQPIPATIIQLYLNLAYASLVQARWVESWPVAMSLFIAHYCTLYARTDESDVFSALLTVVHTETPAGAVPGTVYTLSSAPPGGLLQSLTINSAYQTPGPAYALSGATITLTAPSPSGAVILASWLTQVQTFTNPLITSGAQIAAQGLAGGIQTSKSVGDVSVAYSVLTSLENFGAWNLTTYGQLLATMARVIGSGPVLCW